MNTHVFQLIYGILSLNLNHTGNIDMSEKPPIGIMPKDVWLEIIEKQRYWDLVYAINRYGINGESVPAIWFQELSELCRKYDLPLPPDYSTPQSEPVDIADNDRMDWLVGMEVHVYRPRSFGSEKLFITNHIPGEHVYKSDLRNQIDMHMQAKNND